MTVYLLAWLVLYFPVATPQSWMRQWGLGDVFSVVFSFFREVLA
jgi:hypothetical protein